MKSFIRKLFRPIIKKNRIFLINKVNLRKLKNKDFSIISNNCVGSLISHDLQQPFLSPTVNLFMYTKDFMKFVSNLDFYLQQDFIEVKKENINYPVGKLKDIEVHFMHYENFHESVKKWKERSARINYNNLYILMTDNDNCSEETIEEFENLHFKNKVFLTNKKYNNYSSAYYIKAFKNEPCVGDLTAYKNIFGQKLYDNFDYIKWLNRK